MTNRIQRAAKATATAGIVLLSAALLTGCAGQKHTFEGIEISKLDKTIEALDTAWGEHRANSVAATVSDDSRCYVQSGEEGGLADSAICGPVRYLGQDETGWDSVPLSATMEGSDKASVFPGGSFNSVAKINPNTSLYRSDGKKAPENPDLEEPDTEAAEPAKAIWDLTSPVSSDPEAVTVKTPDGSFQVLGAKVTDRVGGSTNRLKAGDNHKFASVSLSFDGNVPSSATKSNDSSTATTLSFRSGGKDYPIGKLKAGALTMAIPGDGSDFALAVTFDGLTQTVTLADSTLHTTATALYDDELGTEFEGKKAPEKKSLGKYGGPGFYGEIAPSALTANRLAYDPAIGWAPEGKVWLKVKTSAADTLRWSGGGTSSSYTTNVTATTGKASSVSGEEFSVTPAKIVNAETRNSGYTRDADLALYFEVPASAALFSVTYNVNVSGPLSPNQNPDAPATASFDYQVPAAEISFSK